MFFFFEHLRFSSWKYLISVERIEFFLVRELLFPLERVEFWSSLEWILREFRFVFMKRVKFFLVAQGRRKVSAASHAGQAKVLDTHLVKASLIAMSQPNNRQNK